MVAVVTQAPRLVVLRPVATRTQTASGSSAAIVGTVVVADKGKPNLPLHVKGNSIEAVFGKPLPSRRGSSAEGLRQLSDALGSCQYGLVVRAVASDARFPSISLPLSGSTAKSAHAYETEIAIGSDQWLVINPKDGDPSVNRRINITIDKDNNRFSLIAEEKVDNKWVVLEAHNELGFLETDTNDMGIPAYAPTVLESFSKYFECSIAFDVDIDALSDIEKEEFEGGTNGGEPTANDIKKAWGLLRNGDYDYNLAMAAGQYDPDAIHVMNEICDERRVQFRFDAPPWMTETQVKQWLIDLNMGHSYQASCFHYPYKSNDRWYGGKSVWGVSGEATAAKARCFSTITARADVPGVHFSAAGAKRGHINRSGIEPLHNTGFISPEDKVEIKFNNRIVARLNSVDKGMVIGDSLTMYGLKNYLMFEHVVAIHNAIMNEWLASARELKFDPDGLTQDGLERTGDDIGRKYTDSGALVPPRDHESDGFDPFRVIVEQQEIDLWSMKLELCPTGVFRRGSAQAVLIK